MFHYNAPSSRRRTRLIRDIRGDLYAHGPKKNQLSSNRAPESRAKEFPCRAVNSLCTIACTVCVPICARYDCGFKRRFESNDLFYALNVTRCHQDGGLLWRRPWSARIATECQTSQSTVRDFVRILSTRYASLRRRWRRSACRYRGRPGESVFLE